MRKVSLIIFLCLFECSSGASHEECQSPQYLQYRKQAVIHCSFHGNFSAVFWYDSSNIVLDEPIVALEYSVKGGKGYRSGEFNITLDGSLIVNDVDVGHQKNFTVLKFTSYVEHPAEFVVSAVVTGIIPDGCDSPQYLEYGNTGIIHCHFKTDFDRVYWYNSTETSLDAPIVTYSHSGKSGRAFKSGEFDVFPNGSLIIHEVGLVHEHNYTVAKFASKNEDPTDFVVCVIVTVKSPSDRPVVDKCESDTTACFVEMDDPSVFSCNVPRARPAVSLQWLVRTGYGDRNISSKETTITQDGATTSYAVTSPVFPYTSILNLLVCKAYFVPGVLHTNERHVLVQDKRWTLSSVPPTYVYAQQDSTLELKCFAYNVSFRVWKRSSQSSNQYQKLLYAIHIDSHFLSEHQDHFKLAENGSLILSHISLQHDGSYGCIYSDGITGGMTKYKVVTYVNPVPAYPLIDGCNNESHCVLEVPRKGNLTCSMTGFRPEVQLRWKASNELSSKRISFFNHIPNITKNGEMLSITVTSSYSVKSSTRVTAECEVTQPGSDIFPLQSTVDLLFDDVHSTDWSFVHLLISVVWIEFAAIFCLLLMCGLFYRRERKMLHLSNYVRKFCSRPVFIMNTDSENQHNCIIAHLNLASEERVQIPEVVLINCFKEVKVVDRMIVLRSNAQLPVIVTLKGLRIQESGRILTVEEFEDIAKYLERCPMLGKVKFCDCLLPRSFQSGSLSIVQTNRVRVVWSPIDREYCLNLNSGLWELSSRLDENTCTEMTFEEYQEMEQRFLPVPAVEEIAYV